MTSYKFPNDFLWGVATSSQQIEGGRFEAGRSESIWDRFASIAGNIDDCSNPDITCDHYNRYREDIGFMSDLGVGSYRFSVSWPRIIPEGVGEVNEKGLDFYDSLVDELLEKNIKPFLTLYHWDLPQVLQEKGGWANRDIAKSFLDYTHAVVNRLGDRVKMWSTHNEPWCIATLGYEEGHHAPGLKDPAEALRVAHHLLLSHGWAIDVIRQASDKSEIGIVHNYCPAYPYSDSPEDQDAARWFDGFFNRWYLEPLYNGVYPIDAIEDRVRAGHLESSELPFVEDGDMGAISSPTDFLGLNYYSRTIMKKDSSGKSVAVPAAPKEDLTDMGWEVFPIGLFDSLVNVNNKYKPEKIYIAENGAAFSYDADNNGDITDLRRIAYFRDHLINAQRAIKEGVPLAGYYAWSLLDNFEWGFGFEKKFGLYAVDSDTQNRTAKKSASWYSNIISDNSVED